MPKPVKSLDDYVADGWTPVLSQDLTIRAYKHPSGLSVVSHFVHDGPREWAFCFQHPDHGGYLLSRKNYRTALAALKDADMVLASPDIAMQEFPACSLQLVAELKAMFKKHRRTP